MIDAYFSSIAAISASLSLLSPASCSSKAASSLVKRRLLDDMLQD